MQACRGLAHVPAAHGRIIIRQVSLVPYACRAAITPFLAHAAMQGNYKWMLYGDDDTVSMSSCSTCTELRLSTYISSAFGEPANKFTGCCPPPGP